ncbi:AAEL007603-PA [Aedes aegypti]|uniref:Odorant-binding protein 10 n=2 Tax=Aedes aegypti TaxID=7159 RepID=OBP10_AEDAE|nr:general odorant-binding protein 56d [Aedes aegypti]AAL38244.1 odorant-binding protein-related protein [Aedes aegypti]AAL38245.1 odorant-binding protein-related protein [Aedes aegypti]EAT40682.1 AAEL007603-PA [Aedes aegypti]
MTSFRLANLTVFLVLLFCFMRGVHSADDLSKIPEIKGYELHCIEASGITESSAKKLRNGDDIASPDQSIKCYVQCFFSKLRLMNEKGVVQKDKVLSLLGKLMEEDKAKKLAEKCDLRRTNPCDTAYAMYDCYRQNKAKLL